MTGPDGPAEGAPVRASDGERERAAQTLAHHYALGRLTRDELEERAAAVWAARTSAQLRAVTRDLPGRAPDTRPAVELDTRLLIVLLCTAPPAAGVYWLICRHAARRHQARQQARQRPRAQE